MLIRPQAEARFPAIGVIFQLDLAPFFIFHLCFAATMIGMTSCHLLSTCILRGVLHPINWPMMCRSPPYISCDGKDSEKKTKLDYFVYMFFLWICFMIFTVFPVIGDRERNLVLQVCLFYGVFLLLLFRGFFVFIFVIITVFR